MATEAAITDPRIAAEIARYGSLDAAICALWNDRCGARPEAPIHDILKAALKLQGERRASGARAA